MALFAATKYYCRSALKSLTVSRVSMQSLHTALEALNNATDSLLEWKTESIMIDVASSFTVDETIRINLVDTIGFKIRIMSPHLLTDDQVYYLPKEYCLNDPNFCTSLVPCC